LILIYSVEQSRPIQFTGGNLPVIIVIESTEALLHDQANELILLQIIVVTGGQAEKQANRQQASRQQTMQSQRKHEYFSPGNTLDILNDCMFSKTPISANITHLLST